MSPFRRRRPFNIHTQGWSDQLTCDPRSYVRAFQADGRPLYAPCFSWAPGPQTLAVTGDGSYPTLFSANWLVEICKAGDWILYQRTADDMITDTPWDVTPPTANLGARKPSLAFDQSARPAIAWEEDDGIHLRQYDEINGVYAFTGPYPGLDPVLINDAIVNYHVPGSDVILFYLSADRLTLNYRIQSENFDTEHAAYTFANPSIIDLSDNGNYRLQIRYSDNQGAIPGSLDDFTSLLSDLYPYYGEELLSGQISSLTNGVMTYVIIPYGPVVEGINGQIGALQDGVLFYTILPYDPAAEGLSGSIGAPADGLLLYVILPYGPAQEAVGGSIATLGDGLLFYVIIPYDPAAEGVSASIGTLGDGAYV